jgi:hypothetical protein
MSQAGIQLVINNGWQAVTDGNGGFAVTRE